MSTCSAVWHLGDVAQLVSLQPVDEVVLPPEAVLEHLLVLALQVAEALRQQAVVPAASARTIKHASCARDTGCAQCQHPAMTWSALPPNQQTSPSDIDLPHACLHRTPRSR